MNVVVRADASINIGAGHVMRCLTLATALRARGAQVRFVARAHAGNLCSLVNQRGFQLEALSAQSAPMNSLNVGLYETWLGVPWWVDADESRQLISASWDRVDWIVVDHYGIDERWERALSPSARRIAVIDDLADRRHCCDLLLDQNCLPDLKRRYAGLVPTTCVQLLGEHFTLIGKEFVDARLAQGESPRRTCSRILVAFGGADLGNFTSAALRALVALADTSLQIIVVAGGANPFRVEIEAICAGLDHCELHFQTSKMAALMAAADLAVLAGGFTGYEAAFMGLPALLFPRSAIQAQVAFELAARGAAINFNVSSQFPDTAFVDTLCSLRADARRCAAMSRAGTDLFDGAGASRVAATMFDIAQGRD